ncbi:2209_t:CDS:2 [Cetraspora pellucida]|uniref:2209_t:CDS:1 n=1 Tax=Cetraspora pellucida TaxID=1433469 RepID=A0ACA9MTX1_9GLOM|nr:2209_t:CDS:2 [Cetraspora pellucida]
MCTLCFYLLPPEAFIYKNKYYKTCSACLTTKSNKRAKKKALPVDNYLESTNDQIENQFKNEIKDSGLVKIDQDEPFDPKIHKTCKQKMAAIKRIATYLEQEL